MNVEFHYYSTAFLAVKAGFPSDEATTLAYAGQYVDHHHRTLEVEVSGRVIACPPTQNFSFWDPETVDRVLAPFHFLPAGLQGEQGPYTSVRRDGRVSAWDVRANSPPAKALLREALKSRDLMRIGLALHTFSDTWAHQNFTARDESWNRLEPGNRMPSPGHAHAGFQPDLWLSQWTDSRLNEDQVINLARFSACARKVYRYLCTYRGKDFHKDEPDVLDELTALILKGSGRESVDERMVEFVLSLDLEPYHKDRWIEESLYPAETAEDSPLVEQLKKWGEQALNRTGFSRPQRRRARKDFELSPLARWTRAAEEHRALAMSLIRNVTEGSP